MAREDYFHIYPEFWIFRHITFWILICYRKNKIWVAFSKHFQTTIPRYFGKEISKVQRHLKAMIFLSANLDIQVNHGEILTT